MPIQPQQVQRTLPRNLPLMKHRVVTHPSSSSTHSKIRSGTCANCWGFCCVCCRCCTGCSSCCFLLLLSTSRSLGRAVFSTGRTSPIVEALVVAVESSGGGGGPGDDARCVFTLGGSAGLCGFSRLVKLERVVGRMSVSGEEDAAVAASALLLRVVVVVALVAAELRSLATGLSYAFSFSLRRARSLRSSASSASTAVSSTITCSSRFA